MIYDIAVIGLGAIGTFATRFAVSQGLTVAAFDSFCPPHTHGSTHGGTRLIRAIYSEGPYYVPLIRTAIAEWNEVNAQAGRALYHATGAHYFGPPDHSDLLAAIATAQASDLELIDVKAVPGISLPEGWKAVFDPVGGYIEVETTVEYLRGEYSRNPRVSTFLGETVSFSQEGDAWRVRSASGATNIYARHLAVCPGPWAAQVLPFLSQYLRLERHTLHWSTRGTSATQREAGFTPFLSHLENGEWVYGFPADENGEVKIAEHKFGEQRDSLEQIDRNVWQSDRNVIANFVKRFIPDLGQISHSVVCPYTMSPDGDFIIDHLPDDRRGAFVAGLSGHGYKFAPTLGQIVTELAVDGEAKKLDISPFRLSRFEQPDIL